MYYVMYVEFFYCLLLFSRLLSTVMNTMKYFDDGIEWAGDHHETSYTSKVMEGSLSYSRAGPVTGNVYWNFDFDLIHLYGVLIILIYILYLRTSVKQLTIHTAISVMSTIRRFTKHLKLSSTTRWCWHPPQDWSETSSPSLFLQRRGSAADFPIFS